MKGDHRRIEVGNVIGKLHYLLMRRDAEGKQGRLRISIEIEASQLQATVSSCHRWSATLPALRILR
jgi:hypothetical protein